MRTHVSLRTALAVLLLCTAPAFAADHPGKNDKADHAEQTATTQDAWLTKPQSSVTRGSVDVEGHGVSYEAVAGTLVLHGKGLEERTPIAAMSYIAYFKRGADSNRRPITFLYNGGPGSSTVWLHMGAFGPKRVVTSDDSHTPAAPYRLVNNDYSLLDATDLVFIDMPGTGFGRIIAQGDSPEAREKSFKDRAKKIWSVDGDAQAFAQFITQFLSKYSRWNSPKYLFGESYGTTRSAAVANILTTEDNVDLNGVILLSQILNFGTSVDGANGNPGIDLPYELALPTYAATAWYHHKLPNQPADLQPLLDAVQRFALTDYADALLQGSALDSARKQAIAEKLHQYTGLPVDYLLKANLRVDGGMFEHELQSGGDTTTGRLDTRFSGPSMDPLSKEAEYDPQSAAISSAYVSAFNDYVRKDLKFGQDRVFKPEVYGDEGFNWDFKHRSPGSRYARTQATNVMADLAAAMKYDPQLKVMLNGGYYDLATPYFAAIYEMHHLPIPAELQNNISYDFYPSGHMVYAHEPSLKQMHDNVARFIESTDNVAGRK